jgi:hypothetical protein
MIKKFMQNTEKNKLLKNLCKTLQKWRLSANLVTLQQRWP